MDGDGDGDDWLLARLLASVTRLVPLRCAPAILAAMACPFVVRTAN